MKLFRYILLPSVLLAAGFTVAELDAHRKWMDDAQDKKDDVREAIDGRDTAKLKEAAKAIELLTIQEQNFWATTAIKQAKEIAETNVGEARDLLRAANTGRFDDARKAFAKLEATCSACHNLHFEKLPEMAPAK